MGLGFDAHRILGKLEPGCEDRAEGAHDARLVLPELDLLEKYDDVQIGEIITFSAHQLGASFEKEAARLVFPLWIRIREVRPDISRTNRSEKGVHERVDDDVAIAVRFSAHFRRDLHSSEHETAPGSETVVVIAETDSEFWGLHDGRNDSTSSTELGVIGCQSPHRVEIHGKKGKP